MRLLKTLAVVVALSAVAGCSTPASSGPKGKPGKPPTQTTFNQNACLDPIEGDRYRICGRLSTAGIAAPDGDRWIGGTVNSTQADVSGSKYRLTGGTFHADR